MDDRQLRLLQKLPASARQKMIRLDADMSGLFGAARDAGARSRELHAAISEDERFIEYNLRNGHHAKDDNAIVMARERIALKQREIADIDAMEADRQLRLRTLDALSRAVFEFLASVPTANVLLAAPAREPSLKKGEDLPAAIERRRAQVSEIKSKLAEVEGAPVPSSIAKEDARAEIEALARRGKPQVETLFSSGSIEWSVSKLGVLGEGLTGWVEASDGAALVAWLHRDALIAAVEKEIDATADDTNAIAPEERAAMTKKLTAQLLECERDECRLIEQAAEARITIDPRPDVAPKAWLGVADVFGDAPPKPQAPSRSGPRIPAGMGPVVSQPVRDTIWR